MKLVIGNIKEIKITANILTCQIALPENVKLNLSLKFLFKSEDRGKITYQLRIDQIFGAQNYYQIGEYIFDHQGYLVELIVPHFDKSGSDSGNYSLLAPYTKSITNPKKINDFLKAKNDKYLVELFPSCMDAIKDNKSKIIKDFKKNYALGDAYHQPRATHKSQILSEHLKKEDLYSFFIFEYIIDNHSQIFKIAPE